MKETAILANLLMEQLNMTGKPDLYKIAAAIGLRIREVDSNGFEGALIRGKNIQKGVIALKASIPEDTRKRFTIAHEIGHYVIPSHRQLENVCTTNEVESWRKGLSSAEIEANEFAAELLLPAQLIREHIKGTNPSFQRIIETASELETSLTATTRRFIELTDSACAMVWSQGGNSRWCVRSSNFPYYLPLEELPHQGSCADQLFRKKSVSADFSAIPAELWLSSRDVENIDYVFEQSLLMRNYDVVLTILWLPHPPKLEAEQESPLLDDLDPSDFTLMRRRWPQ
ncbi:MAG: ImmA/IrrE family metallo-endopeptidase [Blastocatellia bacterium]